LIASRDRFFNPGLAWSLNTNLAGRIAQSDLTPMLDDGPKLPSLDNLDILLLKEPPFFLASVLAFLAAGFFIRIPPSFFTAFEAIEASPDIAEGVGEGPPLSMLC
jgi:hypothetical protein